MKTKLIFVVIATLLISCNKHECPEQETATIWWENADYWGYYKGTINEIEYDHTNDKPLEGKIESNVMRIANGIYIIRFIDIFINEKTGMNIDVAGMVPGSRDVKFSFWNGDRLEESAVSLRVIGDDKTVKHYIPSEDNPLKLDVLNVVWFSHDERPYIEANIKGVLYERGNSTDSITVDIDFGM